MVIKNFKFSWKVNEDAHQPESNVLRSLKQTCNSIIQRRYTVAFLGFLCTAVMHSHRLNISIAMVAMVNSTLSGDAQSELSETTECPSGLFNSTSFVPSRGEFFWNPELQGYIISAGNLGYLLTQIPGGILTGKFGPKKILIAGLLITSVCNFLSPVAANQHPYILLAVTLIRGMAQGVKLPALSVLMANWFSRSERGFLSAFINCGYPVGALITNLVGGELCNLKLLGGWPLVFYIFGLFSVFVAILFFVFFFDRPEEDPRISETELKHIQDVQETKAHSVRPPTPFLAIFTTFSTYTLVIALFGQYWMMSYIVSVHPLYLGHVLNIPVRQNGLLSAGPWGIQIIVGWCTCYFSYWMSRNSEVRVETIRKSVNSISCIVFSMGMVGMFLAKCNLSLNEFFFFLACGGVGFSFAGSIITAVDMSPTFCGPLTGFATTLGGFAGVLLPVTAGNLTNDAENLTQWGKVFLISAGISLGCGVVFQFLGSAEVQSWDPVSAKSKNDSTAGNGTDPTEPTAETCRF